MSWILSQDGQTCINTAIVQSFIVNGSRVLAIYNAGVNPSGADCCYMTVLRMDTPELAAKELISVFHNVGSGVNLNYSDYTSAGEWKQEDE